SSTLNNIGAWSSVRPDPSTFSASSLHSYNLAKDIHQLGKDYNALSLSQHATSQSEPADAPVNTSNSVGGNSSANAGIGITTDPDYSELDEAILRGRSTTLPNIFAAPNSLYRYSTLGGSENPAPAGPVSPASTSNYSMLSRHGSISVANSNSNRTVSPLGLSLNANPIHQTASLDNHLASPLEPTNNASTQSRPDLLGGSSGMPVRRFSEFNADAGSSLSLASYSMGPLFAGGAAHSSAASESSSATAFGNAGRPPHPTSGQQASTAVQSTSSNSALPTNGPSNRYGSFGYQLPTMREEDASASHVSPPALADSVLMRTMSFSGASAAPASYQFLNQHHAAAGDNSGAVGGAGNLFASRIPSASPVYDPRQSNLDAPGGMASNTYGTDKDGSAAGNSYLPLRVKSLRDLRRPSLDVRGEHSHDAGAIDGHAVNALFERNAGFQHSLSFNHLSSMAGLHRRHSLASTNPHMPTPASSVTSGQGRIDNEMYSMQLSEAAGGTSSMFQPGGPADSMAYQHYLSAGAYDLNAGHLQRQGSTPALSVAMSQQQQQQQQQFAMYHQYTGPIPIGRIASVGPISSGAHGHFSAAGASGARPGAYYGLGSQVQSQQAASGHMQPQLQQQVPPLLRPLPVSHSQQQQQQQNTLNPSQSQSQTASAALSSQALQHSHHMRRASHPALPSLGITTANIPLIAPTPVVLSGSHSSSHTLMPNPATTITPNMPFADMGKGLPYKSLPKGTRVFVVQFKGRRCDLFFAPNKDMKPKVIPALAPSALAIPASQHETISAPTDSVYESGTHVLVEADRGVDLGVIKEELLSFDAIISFSNTLAESGSGGCANGANDQTGSEGRRSVAPADTDGCWSQPLAMANTHTSENAEDHQSASASSSTKDVYVKRIFRVADQREVADLMSNKVFDEQKALSMCQSKVQQRKLSMCVVDAEFQFDRRKLTFYFTAGRRVDFRELVRELFKHFKTRIWMCQQTN
ncbi:hypothetical protein H4R99_007142, partial [Coemansia sp. RSA 1722]